ncbi:uncharacterized protein N7479_008015 [Penicillium vulpinum]|uniref:uncharacterized protein n=1 Tax=Penicillium vulpinum TaxID=29845 RepID=UPI0025492928|nr:uncharacterized protein N7479_008015 [Penicillium vulpinum]KAJ5960865.1 hypothetical protein N7479_008015 [Penicillium vulpinum]
MPDEASNAQPGADTVLTDESWWPQGKYWRASTPFEPTLWASNAKLCNCPEHGKNSWPAEHAIFVRLSLVFAASVYLTDMSLLQHIPNCAKRCPYCPWKTNRNGKGDNPASNLRRHIRQYYILTRGGPPSLENNTGNNTENNNRLT